MTLLQKSSCGDQHGSGGLTVKRSLIIGLMVLSLSGCASAALQRQEEAFREAEEIARECKQRRLAGELPGYLASAQCSSERMRQVVAQSGYPHMDLFDLLLAYGLAAARRVDAGMMSEEEFRLQLTELTVRLNSEAQRRNLMAQQAYSQRLQSMGLFLQGLGVWQQSLTPPTAAPRGPITCHQFGNMIQCY